MDNIASDGGLTYRSIYAIPVPTDLTEEEIDDHTETAIGILVGLGTLTETFGISQDFRNMGKLMNDPIAISIGALLMKLSLMTQEKIKTSLSYRLIDPTDFDQISLTGRNEIRCSSLNLSTLLATNGCIPNATFSYTREVLCVWHSLQPIKKGDRLIYFDPDATIYNYYPKETRKLAFNGPKNSFCDCRACTEDWSAEDLKKGRVESVIHPDHSMTVGMIGELNYFLTQRQSKSAIFMNPDIKTMDKVKDLLLRAWQRFALPSTIITRAVRIYWETLRYFHGQSMYDFK
ncbi:hypothetical protein QAD02_001273 [Eretmocerus hayati]|uniref:Uncharacterized protein n=1 Tax=Eretmocerus hayati TaxID=131215 RepID=A0ACC2NFJ4_9HYME|nr:hypothetical protein QAD02_001273 [Eretmocerus hayati]